MHLTLKNNIKNNDYDYDDDNDYDGDDGGGRHHDYSILMGRLIPK